MTDCCCAFFDTESQLDRDDFYSNYSKGQLSFYYLDGYVAIRLPFFTQFMLLIVVFLSEYLRKTLWVVRLSYAQHPRRPKHSIHTF